VTRQRSDCERKDGEHFGRGRGGEGDRVVRIPVDCESDLAMEKGVGPYLRLLLASAGFASVVSRHQAVD
jgi:hypothetical protein